MAAWPESGTTNWNTAMAEYVDVAHNTDGTMKPFAPDSSFTISSVGIYDSGWVDNTNYTVSNINTVTHNLGRLPTFVTFWISNKSNGVCSAATDYCVELGKNNSATTVGVYVDWMSTTQLKFRMGAAASGIINFYNSANTAITNPGSTYYIRIIAW